MQQHKKHNHRSEEDNRIEGKHPNSESKITFLRPEEDVRLLTSAIIILFHLSLREQVRHLLVNVELFSGDRALRVPEKRRIELLFPRDHGIYQFEIAIDLLRRTRFEARKQCQHIFQIIEPRALPGGIRLGREFLNLIITSILP